MNLLNIFLGVIGGMCLAAQSGINSQLSQVWAHNAILAAATSFTVGTIALFICIAVLRIPIPRLHGTTRWWHWIGGLLGGYLVFAGTYLAPVVGAGTLVGLILMGQLCTAVVLDHYGLIGFAKKPINSRKIAGMALIAVGVAGVRLF